MSAISIPVRRPWFRRLDLNAPLCIGVAIVLGFITCAVFAPALAPHDPLEVVTVFDQGRLVPVPHPPGTPNLVLGSDMLGRDMLSRLLYGARFTLAFATITALVRLCIGITLGLSAGWFGIAGRIIDMIGAAVAAVPALLFGLIIVSTNYTVDGSLPSVVWLAVLLGFTGWTETMVRTQVAVRELRTRPFVEAARALGRKNWGILLRHILPNTRGLVLTEGGYAVAASLLLIAELGFLQIFVGGVTFDWIDNAFDPIHPDWSGMIASGIASLSGAPWIVWEPVILFALAILGFYLLAEGLRRRR